MIDPDPRPPLLPPQVLRGTKVVLSVLASSIAVAGGVITFGVAAVELVHAGGELVGAAGSSGVVVAGDAAPAERAIVLVVKSIDAVLLGLVQFLLAAFLWQILDPKESLVDAENIERLEEAKQILCKVILVIVAVRMLSVLITLHSLRWEHMVFPAGIIALSLATKSLGQANGESGSKNRRREVG